MDRRLFYLGRLSKVLWLRATVISLVAVAAALAAHELGRFVPESASASVAEDTAEELLTIMASSMLAVATFSLATFVAAAGAVISNTSPRAAALLLDDRSAQNALSTFIGAFIFSIVGLIAVGTGFYTPQGRFVLFLITLAVLALVVIRLLRWIDELSRIGRVSDVIRRVEKATERALETRAPFLGGEPDGEVPAGAAPLTTAKVGHVQHIDVARLDALARRHGLKVHLAVLPGAFVRLSGPLLFVEGGGGRLEDKLLDDLRQSVVIGPERTFEQDPRFGLVVLAEIASRALSPAVNDPGTAIDVVGSAVRILSVWAEQHWEARPVRKHTHVFVPGLSAADLFDDVFRPIARDGAAMVEVGEALQKGLGDLARSDAPELAKAARAHARQALARADQALDFEDDRALVRKLNAAVTEASGA